MYTFKKDNIINYLIALIPLSIILGNLAINVNVVLISIAGLFFYKTDIFFIKNKKLQYLLYAFFLYLIIITAINSIPNFKYDILYKELLVKSIFFLRFLIFFLVIYKIIEKGELNINYFLISAAFFSIFLSIDIIIQYIFGKDLFGYTSVGNRRAGFFGTEFIAGGYLKNFSLITIFFLIFLNKLKKNINENIYTIFLFVVFFIPILLTLNRMPALIFFSCFIFFLLTEKKFRTLLILLFSFLFIIFIFVKQGEKTNLDKNLVKFSFELHQMLSYFPNKFQIDNHKKEKIYYSGYTKLFDTGLKIWSNNKIFGNGLKSFKLGYRFNIHKAFNTHPHNYFIEILSDTGLIGLLLIYSIFLLILHDSTKSLLLKKQLSINRFIHYPFFLIFLFEIFPFRSSGSFFTTGNALIIFFIMALLTNFSKIKYLQKK